MRTKFRHKALGLTPDCIQPGMVARTCNSRWGQEVQKFQVTLHYSEFKASLGYKTVFRDEEKKKLIMKI